MDSPFIRDPDHQFAHVIFYALMVNIYIYIYINTFSSPVEHSLTYLGRGRRKINENNERRGSFLMYTFRCGMHVLRDTKLRPVSIGRALSATRTPVDLLQLQHET